MHALTRGPTLAMALIFIAIATLTRLLLLLKTGAGLVPPPLWPGLFLRGLGFDLTVLAWLCAPLLLLMAVGRWRGKLASWQKAVRLVLFWLAASLLLFGALAEWIFWDEFSTRFNFIAVDYLIYTHEVMGNIMESYPVGALLGAVATLGGLLTWTLRRAILAVPCKSPSRGLRLAYAILALALPWAAWQTGDTDQMQFSANVFANELTGNGLMTFAAAARRNELDYDRFYRTLPADRAHRLLAEMGVEREPLSTALNPDKDQEEAFDPRRTPFRHPPRNVVLISVESLSAEYLGRFGNTQGLTPNLDRLAGEGLLFSRLYATGTRTVRGLEALSLGTPPIPGQAIVRRPGNEHLATVGEILKRQGYATYFIYGGYGYFDNMNAYFAGNDYQIIDRTDFPKATVGFSNVWGVADEFLFDNALATLDQTHARGKPFLAHIMTTSNHRPYTYPQGRIDRPSPGGRAGAVKYTDYAIGRFIEQASAKPWFHDTLFVIVADHCASAAGKTKLPVRGYHIPLILYAPALLPPGRNDRLVSQIDIPPTILDVMGLPGDDHFFGKSLFEQSGDSPRAFISNYQELGYLKEGEAGKGDNLVVLGPKQKLESFRVDGRYETTPAANDPALVDEAIAWYQTTFRAFRQGELKMRRLADAP
ncbi:MAG: sulfatase-like hydrolase/transferase [Thiobacillus sp.]|nr:sulfatase-like hydrolase/transferase [Thiobacillus sp.]